MKNLRLQFQEKLTPNNKEGISLGISAASLAPLISKLAHTKGRLSRIVTTSVTKRRVGNLLTMCDKLHVLFHMSNSSEEDLNKFLKEIDTIDIDSYNSTESVDSVPNEYPDLENFTTPCDNNRANGHLTLPRKPSKGNFRTMLDQHHTDNP